MLKPNRRIVEFLAILVFLLLLLCPLAGCQAPPTKTSDASFVSKYKYYDYCRVNVTRQSKDFSCGIACLVSVSKYWGRYISEDQLLKQYPYSPKGYRLSDLKIAAESLGHKAYILSMSSRPRERLINQIQKGRPVICAIEAPHYWSSDMQFINLFPALGGRGPKESHYVVVFGMNGENVLIMNPSAGYITYPWDCFVEYWAQKQYAALLCIGNPQVANH